MSAPELVERIREKFPRALRELPVWLMWKLVPGADDKPKKVPYYADGAVRSGALDTAADRSRLVTFEVAAQVFLRRDLTGLGIALGEVPGEEVRLCGIDLDDCCHAEELDERATQILTAATSYAERSPSGQGIHILGTGHVGTTKDVRGLEIYSGARYFTVTGERLNRADLGELTVAAHLARRLFADPTVLEGPEQTACDMQSVSEGNRNNFLTRQAGRLRRLNLSPAALLATLTVINTERCSPPLDNKEVEEIARSVGRYPAAKQLPGKLLAFPGISEERIAELAALPTLTYQQRRVQEAKLLGIRAKALDEEVERRRTDNAIQFPTVVPWPEAIGAAGLLDLIEAQLTRYVVLPPGASVAITLWVAMGWVLDSCFIAPMLTTLSPQKRCGKTTLLVLLGELCQRSILASNVSGPTLFRVIEQHRPTLLLDEVDSFAPQNEELRGIINSGHSKRSAFVLRCVGEKLEPKLFSTWTPKALAAIGRLPGTVEDRSIIIHMRRKRSDESVALLRQDRLDLGDIRRRLARWSQDHIEALKGADPLMPDGFDGRAADNWRPLLAIADVASGDWPSRARAAAVMLSASSEDDTPAILLLADIRSLFQSVDRLRSADLAEQLAGMECRPWPEWGRARKPITQPQVARLLRPFDIEPRTVRFATGTARGFLVTQFTDAWARYLPPFQADTATQPQP
jgi:uncharacterized protein DUF3631/primase-like protein